MSDESNELRTAEYYQNWSEQLCWIARETTNEINKKRLLGLSRYYQAIAESLTDKELVA